MYSRLMCLVFVSGTALTSVFAEPWHPKQFEEAVAQSHASYKPRRFMDAIGAKPKRTLGLIGHNHGSVKKLSLKKSPFDGEDDDEFVYGEHNDDRAQGSSPYSISQFINANDADSSEDDDSDNDDDSSETPDNSADDDDTDEDE
eukprot:gnl/MRDRNA2_/MRDRNA2_127202_c0_seq1.p1 gnl/MRDRNA2_/MRDRNA2_127202_c0~~gnl/MRDRNA2_/MRDRNA2_127202_c0_seq1.p1  ORF type:complete len:144 (-),score=39.74 gnl/MRDRNA2_/MRDRNA2_127202_c0_seq1:100-531(-)